VEIFEPLERRARLFWSKSLDFVRLREAKDAELLVLITTAI
jgi:hypothetical protein